MDSWLVFFRTFLFQTLLNGLPARGRELTLIGFNALFDSTATGQDSATELFHLGSTAWRDLMML